MKFSQDTEYDFSLVMPTIGRVDTIKRFFDGLRTQSGVTFELIIVDQNVDDRLLDVIDRNKDICPVKHIRFNGRGAARARNHGSSYATGRYITFPDDDCWYPSNLLISVLDIFAKNPYLNGVTGRFTDGDGRSEGGGGVSGGWKKNIDKLNKYNVWFDAIEFTMFFDRKYFNSSGGFNPELGVGAGTKWGAAEGTDLLLKMLKDGASLEYHPDILLHHPVKAIAYDDDALKRQVSYEMGIGFVIRKNSYPAWYFPYRTLRSLLSSVIALCVLDFKKSRFKFVSMKARIVGWLGF